MILNKINIIHLLKIQFKAPYPADIFRLIKALKAICYVGVIYQSTNLLLLIFYNMSINLIVFHVVNFLLWWLVLFVLKQGYIYRTVFLILLVSILYITIMAYILGLGAGYQHFIWIGILLTMFSSDLTEQANGYLTLFGLPWVLSLYIFIGNPPSIEIDNNIVKWINNINIFYTFVVMLYISLSLRNEHRAFLAEFKRLANTDELTGLLNRRGIFAHLSGTNAITHQSSDSLIMIDIDDLKQINDTYGHTIGDMVIIEVAKLLKKNVRTTDSLARIGGDEFLIICRNTTDEQISAIAQSLHRIINAQTLSHYDNVIHIKATLGVAKWDTEYSLQQIMQKVDSHLYNAKRMLKSKAKPL